MKILRIYCKNCNVGTIYHPKEGRCPFCNGAGHKDIEYEMDSQTNSKEKSQ